MDSGGVYIVERAMAKIGTVCIRRNGSCTGAPRLHRRTDPIMSLARYCVGIVGVGPIYLRGHSAWWGDSGVLRTYTPYTPIRPSVLRSISIIKLLRPA